MSYTKAPNAFNLILEVVKRVLTIWLENILPSVTTNVVHNVDEITS